MTNFNTWAFKATGGIAARTMPDRIADVVYAADYGSLTNGGGGAAQNRTTFQAAIDAAFGPASSPHGSSSTNNRPLILPPGLYDIDVPLTLTGVQGGRILGAGRFTTWLRNGNNGANSGVFRTNGFQYCRVEGIMFDCTNGTDGVCWDNRYDGLGTWGVSDQSNTFVDCFFNGGHVGMELAHLGGNAQGSEYLIANCFFASNSTAGLYLNGANSLDNTVVGGDFQTCGTGIQCNLGTVNTVLGVSFQQSVNHDIEAVTDITNTMAVAGCRSESENFLHLGITAHVSACHHVGTGIDGNFLRQFGGTIAIDGCKSGNGCCFIGGNSLLGVRNSQFNRADWMQAQSGGQGLWSVAAGNTSDGVITIENVMAGGNPIYSTRRQRITADASNNTVTRTYDLEASALTDANIAGQTFVVGDIISKNNVAAGGSPGWICTTAGVAGTSAVFKALANVAA